MIMMVGQKNHEKVVKLLNKRLMKNMMEPRTKDKENLRKMVDPSPTGLPNPMRKIIANFGNFLTFLVFLLILRAESATPLALRFSYRNPMEVKFTFLDSSSQGNHAHQISKNLEQFWSLKRPKNMPIFTFLPCFQGWHCALRRDRKSVV